MSNVYYVFITVLISSYEDMIIAALVKEGYQVSALSETNEVTIGNKDSVSAMIALRVVAEATNANELNGEIQEVLDELKILYYSLIVTESVDCSWNVSDIKLPRALPPPTPPPLPNVRKGTGWN